MLNDLSKKIPDPEFVLRCRVEVKKIAYTDLQSQGEKEARQVEADMVFLIPLEGDQRDYMFSKYLPHVRGESTELPAMIPYPVSGFARVALMRRDKRCDEHYLFMMTKAVEEDLKECAGRELEVRILDEKDDAVLDLQKDFFIANKKQY